MADNSASLLPGRNPTGAPQYGDAGFVPGVGTSSGINPILGNPNLPASAPRANPYATSVVPPPTGGVPTFGANAGGFTSTNLATSFAPPGATNVSTAAASPIGGMNLMSARDISKLYGSLKSMYGDAIAHQMLNFLTTGAGFNQQAINNLFAAMQPGIERGTESLMNQFSVTGNRFGSPAQIGLADYLSQVNLNQGQIEAQMYQQAIDNFMNIMSGTASQSLQKKMSSPSTFDKIAGGLEAAAGVAAAPFTGGASLALTGAGIGEMTGRSGGAGGVSPFASLAGLFKGGGGGGPSYMPGDIYGEPTGNLPTNLTNLNTGSLLDIVSSLSPQTDAGAGMY